MHRCTVGRDWLQLSVSLCGNSLPIHPATPYSSCRGGSLPPRAFSAASSVVTMATAAWPWVCCCSYYGLDLNSSPHPRQAHMTWATDLLLIVGGQQALGVSESQGANTLLCMCRWTPLWLAWCCKRNLYVYNVNSWASVKGQHLYMQWKWMVRISCRQMKQLDLGL